LRECLSESYRRTKSTILLKSKGIWLLSLRKLREGSSALQTVLTQAMNALHHHRLMREDLICQMWI
jgi:hypothetical protein